MTIDLKASINADLPELIHRRLSQAVEMDLSDPKRDGRIYGACMLFMAATGDVDSGTELYNQYATEQL